MNTNSNLPQDVSKTSVYDLIPDFGSYLADLESSLSFDKRELRRYEKNPRPYMRDVLMDFGNFRPFDKNEDLDAYRAEIDALVDAALANYGYPAK
jgi:hypothetical protein